MRMAPPTVQGPVLVMVVLKVPLEATHRIMPPVLLVVGRRLVAGPADRPAEVEDHKDEAAAEAEAEDVLL